MSGGRPNSFGVRFTDVYANRGGHWQMVTWQSTRLPESAAGLPIPPRGGGGSGAGKQLQEFERRDSIGVVLGAADGLSPRPRAARLPERPHAPAARVPSHPVDARPRTLEWRARSCRTTRPWVARHRRRAAGMPLVRIYSATAALLSSSAKRARPDWYSALQCIMSLHSWFTFRYDMYSKP